MPILRELWTLSSRKAWTKPFDWTSEVSLSNYCKREGTSLAWVPPNPPHEWRETPATVVYLWVFIIHLLFPSLEKEILAITSTLETIHINEELIAIYSIWAGQPGVAGVLSILQTGWVGMTRGKLQLPALTFLLWLRQKVKRSNFGCREKHETF